MQNTEAVVNRIIDLDARAEDIRAGALAESESVRGDSRRRAEEEKVALEKRIAVKTADIAAQSAGLRSTEIMRVKKEFAEKMEAVNRTGREKIDRAVEMILSRIKGVSR